MKQWGTNTPTNGDKTTYNFPISFTSICYVVVGSTAQDHDDLTKIYNWNKTSYIYDSPNNAYTKFAFIAIGK